MGSLDDKSTLEVGQGCEYVEHQPAAGGRGVDRLGQRAEADAPLPQARNDREQIDLAEPAV